MSSQTDEQSEVVLYQGKFLRLVRRGTWEFVQRTNNGGVVAIIATTDDGRLLLVEQWRTPMSRSCIELPAGLVGDEDVSEDAAASAARELEEETGYRAATMERLVEGVSSAGLAGETVVLFRATGLSRTGKGGGTAGEEIRVHAVALEEVPRFLEVRAAEGCCIDLKVWSALWFAGHSRHAGG